MKKIVLMTLMILLVLSGCSLSYKDDPRFASNLFYSQLSPSEKRFYERLYDHSLQGDECLYSFQSSSTIRKALYAFVAEHPEVFWVELSEYYYSYFLNFTFYSVFSDNGENYNLQTQQQIDAIAQEIIAQTEGFNDYDKLQYFHDYIINHTYYQLESLHSQDVRSVFLNNYSVCAGYAKAFQLLAQKAGFECYTVTGFNNERKKKKDSHAWNLIKIDGQFYWIDVTFDEVVDGHGNEYGIRYEYYLADDSIMEGNHFYDDKYSFQYPICDDDRYNFYKINHSYFDEYDPQAIESYLLKAIDQGEANLTMRFANYDIYCDVVEKYFQETGYGRGFDNLLKERDPEIGKVDYLLARDKEIYKIIVIGLQLIKTGGN